MEPVAARLPVFGIPPFIRHALVSAPFGVAHAGRPSYENKSQAGRIALAISASRSEVPDLCLSPIRSEGRWTSLHSIIRLAGVQPKTHALWRQGTLALTRGRDIQADLDWAAAISLALLLS